MQKGSTLETLERAIGRYTEARRALVEAEAEMLLGMARALAVRPVVRRTGSAEYMALINERPYINPSQAAALMGKSKHIIYDAMDSGELRYIPQGHRSVISREDLDDWMERGAPR